MPRAPLNGENLLTAEQVRALIRVAHYDPDQFRRHGLRKTVAAKGAEGLRRSDGDPATFADLLRCYHATGARTGELASCRVEDVLFACRQVVLGSYTTSRTAREQITRRVLLDDDALAIFQRHCSGKSPTDHVFTRVGGRAWTVRLLAKRFGRAKEVAAVLGLAAFDDSLTIYSLRHLWISEMLMAGTDIATVARMAGTSVAMVERVYGHFRSQHLQDAQARLDSWRRDRAVSLQVHELHLLASSSRSGRAVNG